MDSETSFSSVVAATNSNLTRLSQKMASTANILASPYGDLRHDANYNKAMTSLAGPQFQRRIFSFQSMRRTPSEVVQESLSRAALRSRMLTTLPDELLIDLPAPKTRFSLYQGFQAQRNEKPSMDTCGIEKELATSELLDIDRRIAELQEKRKLIFNRVAAVERQERKISQTIDTSKDDLFVKKRKRKTLPTLQQFYSPGDFIRGFPCGPSPITGVSFDIPFGTLVVGSGPLLKVWDLSQEGDSPLVGSLEGSDSNISCLRMNDGLAVSGKQNGLLQLWDIECANYHQNPALFEGHLDEVTAISLDAEGSSLVSGSQDRTIRHWDMGTGKCLQTLDVLNYSFPSQKSKQADPSIKCVGAVQHLGAALATGTADGVVRFWDLRVSGGVSGQQGQLVRDLRGHSSPVTCLHFDKMNLVSGAADGSVRIWDIRTGGVLDAFSYDNSIGDVAFDSSKVVVSVTGEGSMKVYDRTKRVHLIRATNSSHKSPITAFKYENNYLVEGRADGTINSWAC